MCPHLGVCACVCVCVWVCVWVCVGVCVYARVRVVEGNGCVPVPVPVCVWVGGGGELSQMRLPVACCACRHGSPAHLAHLLLPQPH